MDHKTRLQSDAYIIGLINILVNTTLYLMEQLMKVKPMV
jgi:hypothetical protein